MRDLPTPVAASPCATAAAPHPAVPLRLSEQSLVRDAGWVDLMSWSTIDIEVAEQVRSLLGAPVIRFGRTGGLWGSLCV